MSSTCQSSDWKISSRLTQCSTSSEQTRWSPSYALVKKGGVAVTANRPPIPEEAERLGIEAKFVETNVTTEGLDAFAALVTDGK